MSFGYSSSLVHVEWSNGHNIYSYKRSSPNTPDCKFNLSFAIKLAFGKYENLSRR